MRIVIDLQGAQTESRFRGIGRYSLSLSLAIARQRGEHEVLIALNGLLPEAIAPIREAFDGILPQQNILVWDAIGPAYELHPDNTLRRAISERMREAFLLSLQPDVVLITSLFEGYGDDAITTIGQFEGVVPTATILYDLIPLISPDEQFFANPVQRDYYARKIASLKQSALLLAISERARLEALTSLNFSQDNVVTVSGAFDGTFTQCVVSEAERLALCAKLGITRPFVFYTGGADDRKNLHRLIQAYAAMSQGVRDTHQLVLAGKMPPGHVQAFKDTAQKYGLREDELLIPGYIEDGDLLKLYNVCALFVFPSLHEGFGIPPLEAMSCGAPVIGSHATSLLEVIGLPEAMFDPESTSSICTKMEQALTDIYMRERLVAHGLQHAKTFTWDRSAALALKAMQRFAPDVAGSTNTSQPFNHGDTRVVPTSLFRPRTLSIVILKLDHLGDFFLAIPAITKLRSRYPQAQIDVVVGSWSVALAESLNIFRRVYAFDYFRQKSSESAAASEKALKQFVAHLDPYDIGIDLRRQRDTRFILDQLPVKLKVGYETFNPALDSRLAVKLPSVTDYLFEANALSDVPAAIQMTRLVDALPGEVTDGVTYPPLGKATEPSTNCVAIFPKAGNVVKEWSRDNYVALIKRLSTRPDVDRIHVYFANAKECTDYALPEMPKVDILVGLSMPALIESLSKNVICLANNSFGVHVGGYLGLLVIGIYGGHETVTEWAPVFNNSYVIHQPVPCSPCHIAQPADCPFGLRCLVDIKLETVYQKVDEALCAIEAQRAAQAPVRDARITPIMGRPPLKQRLLETLASLDLKKLSNPDRLIVSRAIAHNHPGTERQLFVDISELVQRDAKSGIQRVVRSVLRSLIEAPPTGFVIVPVYASMHEQGYRQARNFMKKFLAQSSQDELVDEPIFYRSGDQFLGLDLHPHIALAQAEVLRKMRAKGVRVQFVVYDLLCAQLPQHFVPGSKEPFEQWLALIACMDGVLCISAAVAAEFRTWIGAQGLSTCAEFSVGHFHLGADIQSSMPSIGLSETEQALLRALFGQKNYLMVGTIEPRKAHQQVLEAFEHLWRSETPINLVIIGKKGWLVDALAQRLQQHPQLGKRLFWLPSASDQMLESVYAVSTCLIFASEGEGFGLPLIEAAQHQLSIIVRDLPVFKEVAGMHAYYFTGATALELAQAIEAWMALYEQGLHPASGAMPRLTWQQSTQQLVTALQLTH
jgi:glycosyltransferase involved in cell wall biosynthesis